MPLADGNRNAGTVKIWNYERDSQRLAATQQLD